MKKFILAFVSAAALIFTTGCDKNKMKDSEVELDVSITEASFTCGGGSLYFTIACNTEWTLTGMGNGITVTNSSGTGGEEDDYETNVGIIAEENLEGGEKNITLKITAGKKVKEIAVRQDAAGIATINMDNSGKQFYEYLPLSEESQNLIKKIRVTGSIAADDLNAIANLQNIEYVDISGTQIDIIPGGAFSREWSKLEEIILPANTNMIDEGAFSECRYLKKIVVPQTLEHIGPSAFASCVALENIDLPAGVVDIGNGTFYDCTSLKNIRIPEKLVTIEAKVFEKCVSLEEVTIPDNITMIQDYAFAECSSLKKVNFGKNVSALGTHIFFSCKSLTEITLPESVEAISERMFSDCTKLNTVTMSMDIKYIGDGAFANCISLSSIKLPDALELIGGYAFTSCSSLSSVVLPENITEIRQHAFSDCTALTSINLPASVYTIGDYAFYQCEQLATIYCRIATPLSIESYTLYGVKAGCSLRVPASSVEAYKNARYWNKFTVSAI